MEHSPADNLPLISVIIPYYNTGTYLKRCIDSIIRQNYSNLEIILVDDGSEDDTPEIAKEYAKADARVRSLSISHAGVSVARNYGLEQSSGEYILFVDSDDWIREGIIARLMNAMSESGADLATCNITRAFEPEETETEPESETDASFTICSQDEYLRLFFKIGSNQWVHYPVAKLYKKSLLPNPLYPPDIRIGEDVLGTYLAIANVQSVARLQEKGYFYFYNPVSVTDCFDERDFDLLLVWDQVVDAAAGKEPDHSYAVINRKRINFTLLFRLITEVPRKERKRNYADREKMLRAELKACEKDLLHAPIVRSRKILIVLLCHCFPLMSVFGDLLIRISNLSGSGVAVAQRRPLS